MDRLAFTAAAAITEQALGRQHLVHELANLSTVGFKRSYDMALQSVAVQGSGFASRIQPQTVAKDQIQLEGGPVMVTGRPLDVALNGTTVLGVTAADGSLAFTRRGDLRVNAQGVVETGAGQVVRGEGGAINVPPGSAITVNPDGTLYARDPAQGAAGRAQAVGRLWIRDASTTVLSRRSDGLFEPQGRSGADVQNGAQLPSVTPGALEGSNVNGVQAMVRLIDHSRSFETQIRIIKDSKDIDESGASMLRPTT